MKIGFVIYSLESGGAERVVSLLANHFSKQFDVSIFTFNQENSFYRLEKKIRHIKLNSKPTKKNRLPLISNIIRLKQAINKEQITHLYSFTTTMNIYAILANFNSNIKLVISERVDPINHKLPKIKNFVRRSIYKYAHHLVVQNTGQYQFFQKLCSPQKISIIPNPIEKIKIQKVLEPVNIIHVGRLEKQKNQLELIDAFKQANLECKLFIIGDGSLYNVLEHKIKAEKLEHKIILMGKQKEIYQHLKPNWIFASTSSYEGFPNALIEAMNAKLVPVHYDCPSNLDQIIENNQNGYLIPMNDTAAFAQKLKTLYNNESQRIQMAINARKSVKRLYLEKIAKKWLAVIKQ